MKMQPVCSPFLPSFEPFCFAAPLDENDLEEDVDSEPAEIEGEAAEDGDPGDTGAELDDGRGPPSLPLWWELREDEGNMLSSKIKLSEAAIGPPGSFLAPP